MSEKVTAKRIKETFAVGSRWHCHNSMHEHLSGPRRVLAFEGAKSICWEVEATGAQPWMLFPKPDEVVEFTGERVVCRFPGGTGLLTFTRL